MRIIFSDHGINSTVEVNRRFDVPYLAGASNDGKTVYIDRRVPRKLAAKRKDGKGYISIAPDQFLVTHETVEHRLMVHRKMPYLKAHAIATDAEKAAVERAGVDWDNYEKIMGGLLAHIEHEKPRRAPPDLYTKPYPHDKAELLKRLAVRSRAEGGPLQADSNDPAAADSNVPGPGANSWDQVPVDAFGRPVIYITPNPPATTNPDISGGAVPPQQPSSLPGPPGSGSGQNLTVPQSLSPPGPPSPINAQGSAPQVLPLSDQGSANSPLVGPPPSEPGPLPTTARSQESLPMLGASVLEGTHYTPISPPQSDTKPPATHTHSIDQGMPNAGARSPAPGEYGSWPPSGFDDQGIWGASSLSRALAEAPTGVSSRSILDKLLGLGGPRYELWPERIIRSGLSAPAEVYNTGQLTERDPYGRVVGVQPEVSAGPTSTDVDTTTPAGFPSDTAIQRSQDIAALQWAGSSANDALRYAGFRKGFQTALEHQASGTRIIPEPGEEPFSQGWREGYEYSWRRPGTLLKTEAGKPAAVLAALSPQENAALKLWGGFNLNKKTIPAYNSLLSSDSFATTLDKLPQFSGTAYRGGKLTSSEIGNLQEGGVYNLPINTAVSPTLEDARVYLGGHISPTSKGFPVIWEISNARGADFGAAHSSLFKKSSRTPWGGERDAYGFSHGEGIVPKNSRIRIDSIKKVFHTRAGLNDDKNRMWLDNTGRISPSGYREYSQPGYYVKATMIKPSSSVLKTEAGKSGAALAAAERSPFYSAVEQAITNAKQNRMTPDQWIGWLRNQPGVKPEELQWTGLGDKTQLPKELQSGPITKDQLLTHIKENQIQPQLVEKSGEPELSEDELDNRARDMMEEEFTRRYPFGTMDDFINWAHSEEGVAAQGELQNNLRPEGYNPTKYSEYQLPGGDNYRELLLTLPEKLPSWSAADGQMLRYLQSRKDNGFELNEDQQRNYDDLNTKATIRDNAPEAYLSSHWDEPNVLLHMRTNDRYIPGVGKDLHLEELQSDWHQQGRKVGYARPELGPTPEIRTAVDKAWRESGKPDLTAENWGSGYSPEELADALVSAGRMTPENRNVIAQYAEANRKLSGVPDAPFKTTWPDLGLKTAITKAAREGYDSISWTPGEQQVERYDLSKHLDSIYWSPKTNRLIAYRKDDPNNTGSPVIDKQVTPDKLPDVIGKEAADKIQQYPTTIGTKFMDDFNILRQNGLKIGGEGMKGFYDKMLVDKANALGKRFGAKVEWKNIPAADSPKNYDLKRLGGRWVLFDKQGLQLRDAPAGGFASGADAEKWLAENRSIKVPVLRLTPQLKEQALKGMPLFTEAGRPAAALAGLRRFDPDTIDQQLARNPGASIFDVGGHPEMNPSVVAPVVTKGVSSPLGIRAPQIRRLFDNVIGPHMTEEEFADKYLMGAADPLSVMISPSKYANGPGMMIMASLVDPKTNNRLGSIERHIFPGEKAYHSSLEISPDAPRGFTKQMLQNQIDLYKRMGNIPYVDLFANISVGGYAWAKYGWVPDTRSWNLVRTGQYGIPGRLQRLWGQEGVDPKVLAAIPKIVSNPDPKSIWDIADINAPVPRSLVKGEGKPDQYMTYTHSSTKTIGQFLLKGMGWDGRLNLHDPESMDRFNLYISQKTKP